MSINWSTLLVFSCSNDTTIKIWSLSNLYEDLSPSKVQTIKAFHTLNEESDYVRAIDYSYVSNTLFSATDNGIVRQWDVNAISLKAELELPIEVTSIWVYWIFIVKKYNKEPSSEITRDLQIWDNYTNMLIVQYWWEHPRCWLYRWDHKSLWFQVEKWIHFSKSWRRAYAYWSNKIDLIITRWHGVLFLRIWLYP